MLILPAIDLRGGRCVRLIQGDPEAETRYSDDPVAIAKAFLEAGAQWLHVVDLDGAFSGVGGNRSAIADIVHSVDVSVQVGGGIRCEEDVESLLGLGVRRVIIGTAAVENPELVRWSVEKYGPEAVAVAIDARDGRIATEGWQQLTSLDALALAQRMVEFGVRWAVYTDIGRDGMLAGPNVNAIRRFARESGLRVIASGGIASLEDLSRLAQVEADGVAAVIVGKALYEGVFTLPDALQLLSHQAEHSDVG